jgi:hypothetical protein
MLKRLFNYYVVLKTSWLILVFQLIGYFAFIGFQQGQDILRSISLTADDPSLSRHAWFFLIGVLWWSWQSWRAARINLHIKHLHFWQYHSRYALTAQVLIPRILGILPILLAALAIYQAKEGFDLLVFVFINSSFWLFMFYYFRKDITLFLRTKLSWIHGIIPDYVLNKNEAYPGKFIWDKHWKWIFVRIVLVVMLFLAVISFPVEFPRLIGAAAIVSSALGSWLVVVSLINLLEVRIKFPLAFTLIVCALAFSFFNNNHVVRLGSNQTHARPEVGNYFNDWVDQRLSGDDTLTVYLISAEGGGIRSAYWTASVLAYMSESDPQFARNTFAMNGISGGALGIATYQSLLTTPQANMLPDTRTFLKKDYLAPVTGALSYPDILQKILPFPVESFDRSNALEDAWEKSWADVVVDSVSNPFHDPFTSRFKLNPRQKYAPVIIFTGTRAEDGHRVLMSNARLNRGFPYAHDLMDAVQGDDISLAEVVGLSSRFPFLTPPASILDTTDQVWGHVVDGGYFENVGITTLMDVYDLIRDEVKRRSLPVQFKLLLVQNTTDMEPTVIHGLHELVAPIRTVANVWVNNGKFNVSHIGRFALQGSDEIVPIRLDRKPDDGIPLGWYLSGEATNNMDIQLRNKVDFIKEILHGGSWKVASAPVEENQ